MEFKGKIEKLNHIVLSDPTYKNDIWCRYEKKDLNEKNLLVDMDINVYETDMENYKFKTTEFMLLIKKNKDDCAVEDDKFICSKDIEVKEYEIGIDSACVALGINNKAKEIINSHDEWQPSCAIKTGSDGIFGNVF